MLGSYVCRECRARLVRRVTLTRTPQWQPRATFRSLRPAQSQNIAGTPQYEQQPSNEAASQQDAAPDIQGFGAGLGRRAGGRYSKLIQGEAIPLSRPETEDAHEKYMDAVPEEESRVIRGPASLIADALAKRSVSRAWELFEMHYPTKNCEALTNPEDSDLELLRDGRVFKDLVNAVNRDFLTSRPRLSATPTVLLFRYEQLGIARPEFWVQQTIASLTFAVIRVANAVPNSPQRDLPSLLFELLSLWRLFFQCKGASGDPLESISEDWQFPAINTLPDMFITKDFSSRLQDYHPKHKGNSTLGFCAVYLYSIADALPEGPIHEQAAPLARFLERMLAGSRVVPLLGFMQRSNAYNTLPAETQDQIRKEIDAAPATALANLGLTPTGPTEADDEKIPEDVSIANLEALYLKRIARAVEHKESAAILDRLWKEVEDSYTRLAEDKKIPARIYNAFLSGYLVVLSSQRSVEVWNHMIKNQVSPDLQSWVALLEGCAKAQDLNGFNAMWQRMLRAGVEPDNYAWTTRVNGLFSMRQIDQGLAALDDMGKRWLSAENTINSPQKYGKAPRGQKNLPKTATTVNKCCKPTVEVVNGAVSALVQMRKDRIRQDKRTSFVQKILSWASGFDIQPDVRTYNSLIQLYLAAGEHTTAYKLLAQMSQAGLQSDIATYTMLFSAAMDKPAFQSLPAAEQTTRILSMLSDLPTSGVKPNAQLYATLIDRLLKQESPNMHAVKSLVEHMTTNHNLTPSAHVYTSLVTHYFQQQPPNIQAVDAITQQIRTNHRVPTDRILFDRIITGYAAHGEVTRMRDALDTMLRHGKVPDWNAITAVLQAYVSAGDVGAAQDIVHDVQRGTGVVANKITGGATGERRFWATVNALGMGSAEGERREIEGGNGVRGGEGDAHAEPNFGREAVHGS